MSVMSNSDFAKLAESRSGWLKSAAGIKYRKDPDGGVSREDLVHLAKQCRAYNKFADDKWLKSLIAMNDQGILDQIKQGVGVFNHVASVKLLHAQKKIPFAINEMVLVKESGRRGIVVDYLTDAGEYVIALDPFEIRQLKSSDLMSATE